MIKNYILVAFRQLGKHRLFSALNIFCLAIGICFCLLIGQYVLEETQVNAGLKDIHRQYFLTSSWKVKNTGPDITTVGPLPKALKEQYPGLVAGYYRFNPVTNIVSAGDRHFKEDIAIGDTTLVSMYGYPLLYGNPDQAFQNNGSAVITETMSIKLFGKGNSLGKTITVTNTTGTQQDYKISAVLRSIPFNTVSTLSVQKAGFSVFIPFEGNHYYPTGTQQEVWTGFFTVGFLELSPGVHPSQLSGPIKKLLALNSPDNINKNLTVELRPLQNYYLKANGSAVERTLAILSLVALGILLMAVINFVNIMIGTSAHRIKEIGLRKVFGGRRGQLILQYLIESIVITGAATVLSLLFYTLCRSQFNDVLQTSLPSINHFTLQQAGGLVLLTLLIGILAGTYPAFILSGSEVTASVKGKWSLSEKGSWMRKSLLVLQFSIAIIVFIFSFTISGQVNYFFDKDLGYNKDQLMIISAFPKQWDSAGVARMETIRNGLLGTPAVKMASLSFDIPEASPMVTSFIPSGSKDNQPFNISTIAVDENYAAAYGLKLTEGRFFKKEGAYTSGELVITSAAVKAFGWKNAIGQKLQTSGGGSFTVVGVVKDFNYSSLHESIGPLAFIHVKDALGYRYLTVKLQGGQTSTQLEQLKKKWKELSPGTPFEYFFMDDKFQAMYQSELHLKKAAGIATGLMGLIVLLGIFGVLTLALAKRTKEIAIRKVLGAEVYHIITLFLKQYALLIGMAVLIAWPLAYLLSTRWLEQYAYRIGQNAGNYLVVAAVVSAMSFLLISLQCLKVALTNPVKSLKTE
jgi:ABC-type antimicrobial peptide transport system permease subunit